MIWPYISYELDCWEEPSLSHGVPKRTLSYIWLRLYLSMFWFNVGLFTLMKMNSLMVLACPWVLPAYDVEAGVCDVVSCLLYVCMDGRWLFKVFLVSFPKGPGCVPCVLLIVDYDVALKAVDDPTLLVQRVLVFWFH